MRSEPRHHAPAGLLAWRGFPEVPLRDIRLSGRAGRTTAVCRGGRNGWHHPGNGRCWRLSGSGRDQEGQVMANWLSQLLRPFGGEAKEGEPSGRAMDLVFSPDGGCRPMWASSGTTGRWIYDPRGGGGPSAVVEACVAAYAQTIAHVSRRSLAPHRRRRPRAGDDLGAVADPAAPERLPEPQSTSSSTWCATSTSRATPTRWRSATTVSRSSALHPFDPAQSQPRDRAGPARSSTSSAATTSSTAPRRDRLQCHVARQRFFSGSVTDRRRLVPARDVLHVKLEAKARPAAGRRCRRCGTPRPLAAQNGDRLAADQLLRQHEPAERHPRRPTLTLTEAQVEDLRKRWNEAGAGVSTCRRRADPDQRLQVPGHLDHGQGRRDGRGAEADAGRDLHGLRRAAGDPRHDRHDQPSPRPKR